jgi:hypothetical protein
MKNKLTDLNNHLFAQLERLGDEQLTAEALQQESARTDAIVKLSEQIVNNANVSLKAAELIAKHGGKNWEGVLPLVDGKPKPAAVQDFSDEKYKQ